MDEDAVRSARLQCKISLHLNWIKNRYKLTNPVCSHNRKKQRIMVTEGMCRLIL